MQPQKQPVDQNSDQRAPQDQPVAAFEIRVGLGPGGPGQGVEISARRGLDFEAPAPDAACDGKNIQHVTTPPRCRWLAGRPWSSVVRRFHAGPSPSGAVVSPQPEP